METITLVSLTLTNLFALGPIMKFHKLGNKFGVLLSSLSFFASCLMHITDTNHNLKGLFPSLKPYSQMFLNMDRFFSYSLGLYGSYLFYKQFKVLGFSNMD